MHRQTRHSSKTGGGKRAGFDRIEWIDSLRSLACLIVIFAHILSTDPTYGMYANGCGKIGVWLFMLLSGFLFGRSSFHRSRSLSVIAVLEFYEKKIVRVFPEYLIALLFCAALGFFPIREIRSILLLRGSWGHFWYMPVVLEFYLLAPGLALLRRAVGAKRKWLYSGILTLLAVTMALLFPYTAYPENAIQLRWYLPVFLMGVVLSEVSDLPVRKSRWFDILPLVGVAGILALTPLGRQLLTGTAPSAYLQNKYLLIGSLWGLVFLGALFGVRASDAMSRSIALRRLSAYSYDLYLFHYGILMWLWYHRGGLQTWTRGMITVAVAAIIAFLLEKTMRVARKRIGVHVRFAAVCLITIALIIAL